MDAMVSPQFREDAVSSRRFSQLWQLPLLLVSLVLSACAAYLFADAQPVLNFNHKLDSIRQYLADERPEAAVQGLTRLVAAEKLPREHEAQVHLLLAESLDAAQTQRRDSAPAANYQRIVEELQIALGQGAKPTGDIRRRLGECYEALGNPIEAVSQYRQAIAIDPPRALRLQRKVIDLQLAQAQWSPAEVSLDAYLESHQLSDAERAWAENRKAQLLIDRGQFVDARRLLEDALRLDADPMAQAETRYRLGVCAWKLGKPADGQKMLLAAREAFAGRHPLDAAAAVALGSIAQEANDFAKAIALFEAALAGKLDVATSVRALLARATCRLAQRDDAGAVVDLRSVAEFASTLPAPLKEQLSTVARRAENTFVARENYEAAIEVVSLQQSIETANAALAGRLAVMCEKRADQIEQAIADATAGERVRRMELAREFRERSAQAYLASSRALAAAGDKSYAEPLWRGIGLFEAVGDRQAVVSALELWVNERANDAVAPEALARLGKTYEALGQTDQAIGAYQRLHGGYPTTPPAERSAVTLALLCATRGGPHMATAHKVLTAAIGASDANVRRSAGLELARLLHRNGDFKDALTRLEQFAAGYKQDERLGEVAYLSADCCMRLAAGIDATASSASASTEVGGAVGEMTKAFAARKAHLTKAAELYGRTIEFYLASPPKRDADRQFERLARLRRADCAFELADYALAVRLYEQAARDAGGDVAQALAANVQIANAYFALGQPQDARTATERAKQILQALPQGAAGDGSIPMPAAYWGQWLKWTGSGATW